MTYNQSDPPMTQAQWWKVIHSLRPNLSRAAFDAKWAAFQTAREAARRLIPQ